MATAHPVAGLLPPRYIYAVIHSPPGTRVLRGAVILGLLCTPTAGAQARRQLFADWAAANAMPLALADTVALRTSLRPLTDALASKVVVGLGEASHGAHEFGALKGWIIRNLADSGLTDVIFEAPLPAMLAVDAWVQGGPGDPAALLHGLNGYGFWIHETEAMVELLTWLRHRNRDHPRPIHVRGMDQGPAADALACYRQHAGAGALRTLPDSGTAPFLHATGGLFRLYAEADSLAVRDASERLETMRSTVGAGVSSVALRCLDVAIQSHTRYALRGAARSAYRDSTMAENVHWWLGESGPGARAVVWAQNWHIGATEDEGVMGRALRRAMGDDYAPVALLFHSGDVMARPWNREQDPHRDSSAVLTPVTVPPDQPPLIDTVLHGLGLPGLMLDLRRIPEGSPLARGMAMRWPARDVGEYVEGQMFRQIYAYTFGTAFDWIVYVDTVTPARLTPVARRARF
jgi:erythromycin esterase